MKLFGHPDSGHALKVKFFLNWLQVDHEYEFVDIFSERSTRSIEFLKASKLAEVPTLVYDEQYYTQSNAILIYLSEKFGKYKSQSEKQRCLEWLAWEANKIGMCLPQLRGHDKLSQTYPEFRLSQSVYDWLSARYKHDVGVLDSELSDKCFILGNTISAADFSLSAYLMYADEVSVEVPQNVERWLNELREQKGWQNPYTMLKG